MSYPNVTEQSQGVAGGSSSATLLDRAIVELIARRGDCERKAYMCIKANDRESVIGWQCRAAGIAEAIAVCQMFGDAARSNSLHERPGATTKKETNAK